MARTRRVIYDAFQVWSKASKLKFQETSDDKSDIVLTFASGYHADNYPFDGPNIVLAHAFFPAPGMGGDVHFDDDEPWSDRLTKGNTVYLLSTAAHEIGHSLGLGHSKVHNSLMYPYYKYDMKEIKLEYDDVMAVQELYGIGDKGVPEKPPPPESTTPDTWDDSEDHGTTTEASRPHVPSTAQPAVPTPCDTNLDAVARIRNEIFVFKGKFYWRLLGDTNEITQRPSEISMFFYGLPHNLTKVDAVYERADKDRIFIFIDKVFYEFSGTNLVKGPTPLSDLGLPVDLPKIDVAFVWEYNDKTYLFAGKKYWRLNEETRTVEPDYPRNIETVWEKLPSHLDAAFTDKSGSTYFFKDDQVYKFNSYFMRVEKRYPKPLDKFWAHCDKQIGKLTEQAVKLMYRDHRTWSGSLANYYYCSSLVKLVAVMMTLYSLRCYRVL